MPIVAASANVHPDELLDGLGLESGQRQWWAVSTKARQEKRLACDLHNFRIPFYLPLLSYKHVYRGRTVQSQLPLFVGYLFLFASEDERQHSFATNRVLRVLPVEDGAQLYNDLVQIRRLVASNAPLTVQARLQPGRRVRIRHGGLAGLEGTIVSRSHRTQLVITVHFLQQGVSIELEGCLLEPLD